MATRATYHFAASGRQPDVFLYIHHDGYPDAAAERYRRALMQREWGRKVESLAEAFIRVNPGSKLIHAHTDHGDTEWRYTLTQPELGPKRILVEKRFEFTERWDRYWEGELLRFIREYGEKEKTKALPRAGE